MTVFFANLYNIEQYTVKWSVSRL